MRPHWVHVHQWQADSSGWPPREHRQRARQMLDRAGEMRHPPQEDRTVSVIRIEDDRTRSRVKPPLKWKSTSAMAILTTVVRCPQAQHPADLTHGMTAH